MKQIIKLIYKLKPSLLENMSYGRLDKLGIEDIFEGKIYFKCAKRELRKKQEDEDFLKSLNVFTNKKISNEVKEF